MRNEIAFKVYGRYALFTDPITRVGGEKFSYQIPTYQALVGICESIYWKPTFKWVIDAVRIINPIRTQSQGIRPIDYGGGNTLSYYTYLCDVEYEIKAHFEWNLVRDDLINDRNENKHFFVAKRMLDRGGRRDIFLGTRECQAYVEPVVFGERKGFYDSYGTLMFDRMFHRFEYPSETGETILKAYFCKPIMDNGVITFKTIEVDQMPKMIRQMELEKIETSGLLEPGLLSMDEEALYELGTEAL